MLRGCRCWLRGPRPGPGPAQLGPGFSAFLLLLLGALSSCGGVCLGAYGSAALLWAASLHQRRASSEEALEVPAASLQEAYLQFKRPHSYSLDRSIFTRCKAAEVSTAVQRHLLKSTADLRAHRRAGHVENPAVLLQQLKRRAARQNSGHRHERKNGEGLLATH